MDDREKLINEFERYACGVIPVGIINQVEKAIQEPKQPELGWISVEDKLPDKGQIVIVSDGKHTWDVGQYQGLSYIPGLSEGKPNRWNWKKNTVKTVLWWMPKEKALPEPPGRTNE